MTVAELIALLRDVENQDLPVTVEGCDCEAPAVGIGYNFGDIMIYRTQPPKEPQTLTERPLPDLPRFP